MGRRRTEGWGRCEVWGNKEESLGLVLWKASIHHEWPAVLVVGRSVRTDGFGVCTDDATLESFVVVGRWNNLLGIPYSATFFRVHRLALTLDGRLCSIYERLDLAHHAYS